MLRLHRINYPNDWRPYEIAWGWMRQQPDLYSEVVGFYDFTDFVRHPVEQVDFALRDDGELIAFASLVPRGRKVCEFELITPPRPRVRSILRLLRELQRDYFENLGFLALFTQYPDDPKYDRPRRLCRLFGWSERKPGYFEHTIQDHLRANNGQNKKAHGQSACSVRAEH
jgi:hypothetical protein